MSRLIAVLNLTVGFCGILLGVAQAADPAVIHAERVRTDVVKKCAPTVIAIFSSDGNGGGSGVLISPDGYALSNFHVTVACGDFMKCGLTDGVLYDAVIVGIDPTGDVALVKLLGRNDFPYARLGDSDTLNAGDWTYAMGNPFLLATDFQPTVTFGMVSGVHRYQYPQGTFLEYTDCIQVDTSINPGNSGGPLFNAAGELIGINGRIAVEKRGRVNVGAGYAISINQIKHFMDQLRGGHVVDHATLGVSVRSGNDRAVLVDSILESSDAYRRGLREDDEIVSFAGRPIGSVNQIKNILGIYPRGWSVPLVYRRDGIKHEIVVQLPAMHARSELAMPAGPKAPRRPGPPKREPKAPNDSSPLEAKLPEEKLPEEYQKQFEKKAGYANYYFNQLEQRRVLSGLAPYSKWQGLTNKWNITGVSLDGDRFQIKLLPQALTVEFMKRAPGLQRFDGSDFADEPPGSGGFLAALYQLKLLLCQGPTAFSNFQYEGSLPLDGRGERVDVLISKKSTLECRWYFRVTDGEFSGFDSSLGSDVDACKIRFVHVGEIDGKRFPDRMLVRYGDTDYGTFEFQSIEVSTSSEAK